MVYKMPIRREKAAGRLAAALKVHGELIAEKLEPQMTAVLEEGEELPDVAHLLDVLGRIVQRESQELETADRARSKKGAGVRWVRKQLRDRVEPELRSRVVDVRDQMRRFFGTEETQLLLDHKGRTPRGLEGLEDLAVRMVRVLPVVKPPKAVPGVTVQPAEWAEYLQPALDEFSQHLDELSNSSEGETEVVGLKKKALAAFDRTYSIVLRMGELFYQFADLERMGKHLRYKTGRPTEQVLSSAGQRSRRRGPTEVA